MNFLRRFLRPVADFDPEGDVIIQRAQAEMAASRTEKELLRLTLQQASPDAPFRRDRTGFSLGDAAVGRKLPKRDGE